MTILFISGGGGPEYLCDMLFHGLRRLEGADVVDVNRLWYMYRSEFENDRHSKAQLYGRGFSIYGLLDDDDIDRDDIEAKVHARLFDLVIFGSVTRCRSMMSLVLEHYPPDRILFVDGEDEHGVFAPLIGRGIYLKRELASFLPGTWPIQFALPEERINMVSRQKIKTKAFIDPNDRNTYIYDTEADYYADYAESLFGVTKRKAGWDCLRHYEIMGNNCIPLFMDIEKCPPLTMTFLPKFELWSAKELFIARGPAFFETKEGLDIWSELHSAIGARFRRHCTTVALAKYVLAMPRAVSGPSPYWPTER